QIHWAEQNPALDGSNVPMPRTRKHRLTSRIFWVENINTIDPHELPDPAHSSPPNAWESADHIQRRRLKSPIFHVSHDTSPRRRNASWYLHHPLVLAPGRYRYLH